MDKIVFIGKNIEKPRSGGEICSLNNKKILESIFGNDFYFYSLRKKGKLCILINKIFFFYPGISLFEIYAIISYTKKINPRYIFVETSLYGKIYRIVKRKLPEVKIITFFQNIEILYAKSFLKFYKPNTWYFYLLTKINEKNAIKYSDYRFSINKKDSDLMNQCYGVSANIVMPFSIENKVDENDINSIMKNNSLINKKECLFVGSNFFGNTEGLNWFIEHVLPKVDIHLTIVGSGMKTAFFDTEKIKVFDFVDDLSVFYKKTDFVILPIISGGGMKTKTAEAMMWGKAIIGSANAFEGYEIKDCSGLYVCDSPKDYIDSINSIYDNNIYYFNRNIHDRFVQYHSIDTTKIIVKKFIDENK